MVCPLVILMILVDLMILQRPPRSFRPCGSACWGTQQALYGLLS